MSTRFTRMLIASLGVGSLALAGCGTNNATITAVTPTPLGRLMFVGVVPNVRPMTLSFDGGVVGGKIRYGAATGYYETTAGSVHVNAVDPSNVTVVDTVVPLTSAESATLFACDSMANAQLVRLDDDLSAVPAGKARVRFLHLAAGQPAMSFVHTNSGALAPAVPYLSVTPWMLVDAGSYDLEADSVGTGGAYAVQPGVPLASQGVYTLFLRGPGASGVPKVPGIAAVVHR